jgi:mono/diheme cytochrome c family protein
MQNKLVTLAGFSTRAMILIAAVLALSSSAYSQAQKERSVADRVFSDSQAKRGLEIYDQKCASCHDGGTMGPELWGPAFLTQWSGKDVDALHKVIAETMPQEAPGSLSEGQTLDAIAYVLQQNEFAAGPAELTSREQLKGLKFPSVK